MDTEERSAEIAIDSSIFSEVRVVGKVEDIKDYVGAEKRPVTFFYTNGGSIHTDGFLYRDVIYFGACDNIVYGVDFDGKKVFEFKCPDIPWHPVVCNNVVYFGCYDKNLYAVTIKGKLLWKFPTMGKVVVTPAVNGGRIYFGSEDRNFYAVTEDGKLAWKFETSGVITSNAFVHENMVLLGSVDGNLYALDKSTGRLLWKFRTNGYMFGSPIVHNRVVYVGSYDYNLYALTLDGKELWRFAAGREMTIKPPAVYKNIIYLGIAMDNNIYAIKPDGKLLWKYPMNLYGNMTPNFHGNTAFFSSTEGVFLALDARTGKKQWEFRAKWPIVSSPVVHGGRIFFGCWDCNFYCIDMEGRLMWKFPTSTSSTATINVPERAERKMLKFAMKPQEVKKEVYKSEFSSESVESVYTFDIGYKIKSEYSPSKKYRR